MSADVYWRDTYNIFGPLFYELVGYYESSYNREPEHIVDYAKVCPSSEVLPIYGITELPKHIMYLSQLPLVNRLRDIQQLSYTHILFPGATHTRYEHSLGVMNLSCSILNKLSKTVPAECESKGLKLTNDDQVILGIAALLHDLGHPAWGHALDGITGFVVELLGRTMDTLLTPKKLDIAMTLYLVLENNQMLKALENCSKELKNPEVKDKLSQIVAQIIMEEEKPLFAEMADNDLLLKKIHLLTTILGTYQGVDGINGDRIDWIARDAHHANLGAKLEKHDLKKYERFIDRIKKEDYKVGIKNCEFAYVDDPNFTKTMKEIREKIYVNIYEGIARSFSDSLLTRLVYSATNVLDIAGTSFASPTITIRAIMGYLLMPDSRVKDFTNQILYRAKQNHRLLDSPQPSVRFIAKSYDLLKLYDESTTYIMHYLSSATLKEQRSGKEKLGFSLFDLDQIDKTLIVVTATSFSEILGRAYLTSKSPEVLKIAVIFQDILLAARTNPIVAMRVHALENSLQDGLQDMSISILVNYYFFRRLEDCFKEVHNLKALKKVLEEDLKSTPVFFILTSKQDLMKAESVFEGFSTGLMASFISYFQSIGKP
ncbi:MAG: HD domain-containing protein [Candidatus Bathyarchaeia archaeon]